MPIEAEDLKAPNLTDSGHYKSWDDWSVDLERKTRLSIKRFVNALVKANHRNLDALEGGLGAEIDELRGRIADLEAKFNGNKGT